MGNRMVYRGLIALVTCWVGSPAMADTVTFFGGGTGPTSTLGATLTAQGLNNPAFETTAETFLVPGPSGTNTILNFSFVQDLGGFTFAFATKDRSSVTADPITQKQAFAVEAAAGSILVFNDATQDPGATASFSVLAGTELIFFIIPNSTREAFLADPSAFYDPANQGFGSGFSSPLFSIADANPGQRDQFMAFVGNGKTLFAFEDLDRSIPNYSDDSFTDLVFSINTQLAPVQTAVPLPGVAMAGGALLGGMGLKRRRTKSA